MYALRRLLYLPLSLFLLSLVCFGLRQVTPGDPIGQQLPKIDSRRSTTDPEAYDRIYRRAAASLGYDKPVFYFTLRNGALPDTLHRVARPQERAMLRGLTLSSGNWPAVQTYYQALRQAAYYAPEEVDITPVARRLLLQDDPANIARIINSLPEQGAGLRLSETYEAISQNPTRARLLLPALQWHGFNNQYHHWLRQVLRGDFGNSYLDRRPVMDKILPAIKWTALLNGLAFLVVFSVAIPLGLLVAGRVGSAFDQTTTILLFLLFGIPNFWIATLIANFFTTPAFGMDFFPSMGFGDIPVDASWWTALSIRGSHLFLPVLCLSYPSFAYISRHLRRSAIQEMGQAYVKTARLKGLSTNRILWGHVFRNASFPIITLLGSLLPGLLAGSILIERIFNLPGMGQLLFTSATGQDWPVVITLVLLNGLLTDPRVRLGAIKASEG